MFARGLRWGEVAIALMLGSGLFVLSGNAFAQTTYVGDYLCSVCHSQQYTSYKQHGHPWMEVYTGGQTPSAELFAPVGEPLPPLPTGVTWSQVLYIVGNFKTGQGDFLLSNGNLAEESGSMIKPMPATCNNCHSTGFNPAGHQDGFSGIQGSWALDGIQCEECHGPGPSMHVPSGATGNALCRDCHSSGDPEYRIPFNTTTMEFSNNHPQGDEYRRSPHQNQGCYSCHDPHRSVWHNQGGVLFAENSVPPSPGVAIGNMCTECHSERVRTVMGQLGLMCTNCHMPEISASGTRTAHLFKINPTPLAAASNVITQESSSGKPTTYWMNQDGTTSPNGLSFLTLDLVCTQCHSNQTLQEMSSFAPFIHRAFGMIDLTVNGSDSAIVVNKNQKVTVKFSVVPTATYQGMPANWFVMAQEPTGWSSWDGKRWVRGQHPLYLKNPLTTVPTQTVMNEKLKPGNYTFWVCLYPSDGSQDIGTVSLVVMP